MAACLSLRRSLASLQAARSCLMIRGGLLRGALSFGNSSAVRRAANSAAARRVNGGSYFLSIRGLPILRPTVALGDARGDPGLPLLLDHRLMFVLTVTRRGKVGSDWRRRLRVDREIPARRSNSRLGDEPYGHISAFWCRCTRAWPFAHQAASSLVEVRRRLRA